MALLIVLIQNIPDSLAVFAKTIVIGWTPLPSDVGSVNPKIPCLNGRFPVAIDVHSMGESDGRQRRQIAHHAVVDHPGNVGASAPSIKRWMTFQSAASHPINRTFLELFNVAPENWLRKTRGKVR